MNTKWLKITNNLDFEEMDTPDDIGSESVKYWIKGINSGSTHQTSSGYSHELWDYEIYDRNLNPCDIKEFDLTCSYLHDRFHYECLLYAAIVDSYGETKSKEFSGSLLGQRFEALIVYMKRYGSIKSWETIDRQEKIEDLYLKIQKLEKENKNLEEMLDEINKEVKTKTQPN